MPTHSLASSYQYCLSLARSHYENFPVASRLLPSDRRPAIAAVYAFARLADDMADEGQLEPHERLHRLDDWQRKLETAVAGSADHPVFEALADTIERYHIEPQLFSDLLTAFRQDVVKHQYASFVDVLSYCRCSANPVGRIVLHIFEDARAEHMVWSDAICTALQLTNFWQDVSVDLKKGRFYLPLEDLDRFRYTQEDIRAGIEDQRFRDLIRFETDRTKVLFAEGAPLVRNAPKSLRFELSVTWNGGMRILQLIERNSYRVLSSRPSLGWQDGLMILVRGLLTKPR